MKCNMEIKRHSGWLGVRGVLLFPLLVVGMFGMTALQLPGFFLRPNDFKKYIRNKFM